MAGLDGSNIPLADLLEKIPNSVCPGDESGSTPAAPGVPVTLHGIVCHEIGGNCGFFFTDFHRTSNIHAQELIL